MRTQVSSHGLGMKAFLMLAVVSDVVGAITFNTTTEPGFGAGPVPTPAPTPPPYVTDTDTCIASLERSSNAWMENLPGSVEISGGSYRTFNLAGKTVNKDHDGIQATCIGNCEGNNPTCARLKRGAGSAVFYRLEYCMCCTKEEKSRCDTISNQVEKQWCEDQIKQCCDKEHSKCTAPPWWDVPKVTWSEIRSHKAELTSIHLTRLALGRKLQMVLGYESPNQGRTLVAVNLLPEFGDCLNMDVRGLAALFQSCTTTTSTMMTTTTTTSFQEISQAVKQLTYQIATVLDCYMPVGDPVNMSRQSSKQFQNELPVVEEAKELQECGCFCYDKYLDETVQHVQFNTTIISSDEVMCQCRLGPVLDPSCNRDDPELFEVKYCGVANKEVEPIQPASNPTIIADITSVSPADFWFDTTTIQDAMTMVVEDHCSSESLVHLWKDDDVADLTICAIDFNWLWERSVELPSEGLGCAANTDIISKSQPSLQRMGITFCDVPGWLENAATSVSQVSKYCNDLFMLLLGKWPLFAVDLQFKGSDPDWWWLERWLVPLSAVLFLTIVIAALGCCQGKGPIENPLVSFVVIILTLFLVAVIWLTTNILQTVVKGALITPVAVYTCKLTNLIRRSLPTIRRRFNGEKEPEHKQKEPPNELGFLELIYWANFYGALGLSYSEFKQKLPVRDPLGLIDYLMPIEEEPDVPRSFLQALLLESKDGQHVPNKLDKRLKFWLLDSGMAEADTDAGSYHLLGGSRNAGGFYSLPDKRKIAIINSIEFKDVGSDGEVKTYWWARKRAYCREHLFLGTFNAILTIVIIIALRLFAEVQSYCLLERFFEEFAKRNILDTLDSPDILVPFGYSILFASNSGQLPPLLGQYEYRLERRVVGAGRQTEMTPERSWEPVLHLSTFLPSGYTQVRGSSD